jgi:hypothetical protein
MYGNLAAAWVQSDNAYLSVTRGKKYEHFADFFSSRDNERKIPPHKLA